MKSKWQLFSSIFQIVIGALAILAFIILYVGGEDVTKWIITLVLAVLYVILGIIGIVNYRKSE